VDIPGIGIKTANKLLTHLKSVNRIKSAEIEELEALIGRDKSEKIREYFTTKLKQEFE
jgi:excinuclease ABC subunit C